MKSIIEADKKYLEDLVKMGLDLWPDAENSELKETFSTLLKSEKNKVLLFFIEEKPIAFIYMSIRSDYVEGSGSSPVGYVEGIYTKPEFRKKGIAKMLLIAGEKWAKEKDCTQIGSDIYINNKTSYDFHTHAGFKEAGRLIAFIKDID